jgi:hypothetical protein
LHTVVVGHVKYGMDGCSEYADKLLLMKNINEETKQNFK